MKDIVDAMNWRYATKKFSDRKLSQEQIDALLEALRLTPSSVGLQAWKFIVVENPEVRASLQVASWGQSQVVDASHFIVLCRKVDVSEKEVNEYIGHTAEVRSTSVESLEPFRQMVQGAVDRSKGELERLWLSNQVYIALGTLLTAAAVMGVDATPMEGLDPAKYDEILGLKEKGLATVVACALGFRDEEDKYATTPKVRFPKDKVIEVI